MEKKFTGVYYTNSAVFSMMEAAQNIDTISDNQIFVKFVEKRHCCLSAMNQTGENTEFDKDFEYIYNKYNKVLISFSRKFINNREDIKNIVHDSFISLFESMDRVDRDKDVLPYLFTITKNKCISYLRKKTHNDNYINYTLKRKTDYLNLVALENENSSIYVSEVRDLLKSALEEMNPRVKNTFILSRMKGYTHKEIAAYLGVSERAVEERMKKAMTVLNKTFEDHL